MESRFSSAPEFYVLSETPNVVGKHLPILLCRFTQACGSIVVTFTFQLTLLCFFLAQVCFNQPLICYLATGTKFTFVYVLLMYNKRGLALPEKSSYISQYVLAAKVGLRHYSWTTALPEHRRIRGVASYLGVWSYFSSSTDSQPKTTTAVPKLPPDVGHTAGGMSVQPIF